MKALVHSLMLLVFVLSCPRAHAEDRYRYNSDRYDYEAQTHHSASWGAHSQTTDRATAMEVQRALGRKGFYYGPPDGILGPQSREAIRQYQRTVGLKATGLVDDRLLKSLHIGARETYPSSYGGARSKSVASDVQGALARRGFYSGRVDGVIGSRSREAIRQFQLSHGLRPTGGIDESLLRALGLL